MSKINVIAKEYNR